MFFDVRDVVDARFRVKQMSASDMGLAALQRQQASQAADIRCCDLQFRVSQLELVFEYSDGEVVTTRAKDGIFNFLFGPQQFHLYFLARIQTFDKAGDAQ